MDFIASRRRTDDDLKLKSLLHVSVLTGELASVVNTFAPSYMCQPDSLVKIVLYALATEEDRYIYTGHPDDNLLFLVKYCVKYGLDHPREVIILFISNFVYILVLCDMLV